MATSTFVPVLQCGKCDTPYKDVTGLAFTHTEPHGLDTITFTPVDSPVLVPGCECRPGRPALVDGVSDG